VAWILRSIFHKICFDRLKITRKEENMKSLWKKIVLSATAGGSFFPALAQAAGEKADRIVIVADTRRLTGWEAWWANLYNESHAYFTLVTIIVIPLVGLILGLLADMVMNRIGIDLSSRELAEH